MSNRNYATDYVVHAHYELGAQCGRGRARDGVWSTVRSDVTCRRCLVSLAKRDREFQRKARSQFKTPPQTAARKQAMRDAGRTHAARAIARDEGRAL
jgi:hypothetical protein